MLAVREIRAGWRGNLDFIFGSLDSNVFWTWCMFSRPPGRSISTISNLRRTTDSRQQLFLLYTDQWICYLDSVKCKLEPTLPSVWCRAWRAVRSVFGFVVCLIILSPFLLFLAVYLLPQAAVAVAVLGGSLILGLPVLALQWWLDRDGARCSRGKSRDR